MRYPSSYEREIWHYQRANVDEIQRGIEQFSWEKSFRNLNINETITYDDKDPHWFNRNIKQLI